MMLPTKKYSVFLILVLFSLLLVACAPAGQPQAAPTNNAQTEEQAPAEEKASTAEKAPAEAASTGGTVRIGWGGSPDTINPGTAILSEAYTLFELVYDAMYDLNLDGSFSPSLAESVEVSDDGTVWTFKIRDGVKFHDGQDLTAEDIAFSYNFYQAHTDFPYLNSYTEYFTSVEAPDDQTVVVTLSEPIPNIESQLLFLYVLPEHIWAQYSEGDAAAEFENLDMIGSGPFKMAEYKQNEFVHLLANKDHFNMAPKIDEAIFQTFANPDALVQALTTGQVDMITEMPNTAVPVLRDNADIVLATGAPFAPEVRDIIFNQVSAENCPPDDGICSGHPALLDRNVRLALAHATDKQNIIDVALLGLGTPGLTLIPDGLGLWYNDTITDYEFDLDKANQILEDAGYKDSNADAIREMPDGSRPLEFRLYWPNDVPEGPRIAEVLVDNWGKAGVKLQPQAYDPDALTSACCPGFDFDVIIWGWGSDPDPSLLLSVMTTSEIPNGLSETGYSNPNYDELYNQQATELDRDKRKALVWEMQQIVHDDVVYVIPFYAQEVQAYRTDRFKGWLTDAPKLALEDVTSLSVIEPVQ